MADKRILVGIGGGIAAYKSATLVSRLVQRGVDVRVVMTKASENFVGRATFAALSGKPVATDMFAPEAHPLGPHIELAVDLDLLVIAPATADMLARLAHGMADSLLAALFLQVECPVLLAPAMSNSMWEKPSVQRNVSRLIEDGVHFIGPEPGWLSCRQLGLGRMAEPESIAERAFALVATGRSETRQEFRQSGT